jgi:glutamate formiminotransferase / 5-formyltetrahydrofolate cyclo-ligase
MKANILEWGATDVVPFIPVKNMTVEECDALAKETGKLIFEAHQIPVFLYEKSASKPNRQNLADVRKGQFEGMFEKVKQPEWTPDFGTDVHPTAGVTAVGTRMALVAFNVNLNTNDMAVADRIAKNVRHLSGGLRYCKAMGVELKERGIVQISMNMTDYTKTPLHRAFELIRIEAERYGVSIVGSEIIGNVPLDALIQTAEWYLRIENFDSQQVLEKQIWE